MFTKNSQFQPTEAMIEPPMIGPRIGASWPTNPMSAIEPPIRSLPAARLSSVMETGSTIPPPMPCSTRNPMSDGSDQARPHSSEPTRKAPTANIHTRRAPNRSEAHPETGMTATYASR